MGNALHNKRKQQKKTFFYVIETVLVIAAVGLFILFGKWDGRFNEQKWSEKYVSNHEVALQMQFFVYTKEEWQEFFDAYEEPYLTYEKVAALLKKTGVAEEIPFVEKGKQREISREEWFSIYEQIRSYLDIEDKVLTREVLVLSGEQSGEWVELVTNEGIYVTKLPNSYFKEWETYQLYFIGEECVGVVGKGDGELRISNVYILEGQEDKIRFLYLENMYEKEAELGEEQLSKGVADILVRKSKITTISQKQDYIVGNLLSYDSDMVEVEGYGRLARADRLPVYQVYGDASEQKLSDIIIGNMEVKFVIGVDEVCAVLIMGPAEINDVRVLLLAEDGGKFRDKVYLTSDESFVIKCKDKESVQDAGTIINVDEYIHSREETLTIIPQTEQGYIYLCNKSGKRISNPYSGQMEVRAYEKGYCVVNEVAFETYLYSVVPSEMPSNYQPEALKAQAVCARSYAYIQVMRAGLAAYGAHINDSSSYQVYNNIAKTAASVRAVDETAGKVMLYEGDVIEAYYFSTSMGYTDTVEVWNVQDTNSYGYLRQACLNHASFDGDLSTEEGFKEYLRTDVTGYDSDIRYYRWQIVCEDYASLEEDILVLLEYRKEAMDRHVTYFEKSKRGEDLEVRRTQNFGKMLGIEVAKRSKAGSILELKVDFENGYIIVQNEYNIRKVLGCAAKTMTLQNGKETECSSLIPSAFCTVEKQPDGTYLLCGGGYGHGLGMSQNGANGLAKSGYSYEDILYFFYQNVEIVDIRE